MQLAHLQQQSPQRPRSLPWRGRESAPSTGDAETKFIAKGGFDCIKALRSRWRPAANWERAAIVPTGHKPASVSRR